MIHSTSETFTKRPIRFVYPQINNNEIEFLRKHSSATEIPAQERLHLENRYFKDGIGGSRNTMFARAAVVERLIVAIAILSPELGIILFDAFRATETQQSLFEKIHSQIKLKYPLLTHDELLDHTRKYVAHPSETSRFAVSPHNSGGAVDVTLTSHGSPISMGGKFDEPSEVSRTDFFELPFASTRGFLEKDWNQIRRNRRVLFHSMCHAGFTNYREEWWHYDLGDCLWSEELGVDWVYGPMEAEVYTL